MKMVIVVTRNKKIGALILCLLITTTLTGCAIKDFVSDKSQPENAHVMDIDEDINYETDPYTGVEYVVVKDVKRGGVTVRVDRNGKPIINRKWLKQRKESEK